MHALMQFCHGANTFENVFFGTCIAFSALIPVLHCIWNAVTVAADQIFFLIWNIAVHLAALTLDLQKQFLLFL